MYRLLTNTKQSDEIVLAQLDSFKNRVPILYGVRIVSTAALSITHVGEVPIEVAAYAPALACLFMLRRIFYWMNLKHASLTADGMRALLRRMNYIAIVLAVIIPIWCSLLYLGGEKDYSDSVTLRGYIAIYLCLTGICGAALLVHSRPVATLFAFLVTAPFCMTLMWHGGAIEIAVGGNILVITAAFVLVFSHFSQDFDRSVLDRRNLKLLTDRQSILVNTDTLTGLASRIRFLECFRSVVASADPFSLVMIDLDGFKQINDGYGHLVGDQVLAEVGRRLDRIVSTKHCLARIGGDEFALVCELTKPDELDDLCNRMIAAISRSIDVDQQLVVKISASVGVAIALGTDTREARSKLIEQADYALSHVKQTGKGSFQICKPEHEQAFKRRGVIEQALRTADLNSEINLLFQPVISRIDQQVIGFEALARWQSTSLGLVSPAEFIPAAERSGDITDITLVVVAKALDQAKSWPQHIRLKINLSANDLNLTSQMLRIIRLIGDSGIAPSRLTFEVTETALGGDLDVVDESLRTLKALGSSIAIDDFGTGYCSLSYVYRFRPDLIKIDRSFIARIGNADGSDAIVKTIIELCRNMGSRSLAEGVETQEQARCLLNLGVDEFQGYYFGRPMPGAMIDLGFCEQVFEAA